MKENLTVKKIKKKKICCKSDRIEWEEIIGTNYPNRNFY